MVTPHLRALAAGTAFAMPILALAPLPALAQQSPCGATTTVQPGDTYFAIAQRCDVSIALIEQANPGVDPHSLQIGETLELVAGTGTAPTAPDPETGGQAEPGDATPGLAQALGLAVGTLLQSESENGEALSRLGDLLAPAPSEPQEPRPETQVSGILTAEGTECQAMRGHDGHLYTLVGELGGHDDGDVVRVRGEVQEVSFCQQGTTIAVAEIDRSG